MTVATLGMLLSLAVAGSAAAADGGRRSIVPHYDERQTKNGVTVYHFESANVPLFEIRLEFEGGSELDPPGRSGLSVLAGALAEHGAGTWDEDEISRRLDDVAGSVEVSVDEEETVVTASGMNSHSDEILGVLFKVLSEPTFPDEPYQRLKRSHIDAIQEILDNPEAVASEVLDAIVFNRTIKSRPSRGYLADVRKIDRAQLREQFSRLIRTDRMKALVVGGGRGGADVFGKVAKGIEAMPCPRCGEPVAPAPAFDFAPARQPDGAIVLVDRPGIEEAHVHMGFLGPKRKIDEYYDLRVAEAILSGPFGSRLNSVIREKLGLTYNISAGFSMGRSLGEFTVVTSTRPEKLAELLTQVRRILGDCVSAGFTDDEVRSARDYLTGAFPLALDSAFVIADTFFSGVVDGLGAQNVDRFRDGVAGVSRQTLEAAVRKYLKLAELRTVVVGDRRVLGPRLKAAGLRYVEAQARRFL